MYGKHLRAYTYHTVEDDNCSANCCITVELASVPGFSFMQYGCGAENTAKKKKSLVDFDHVGTVTCNGMQFCHTSYLGVK